MSRRCGPAGASSKDGYARAGREWTGAIVDELIDSAEGVATELDGFRGSPLLDRAALRELIVRFTLLLTEVPEVVEADLNPVRCTTNGCVVLDMRLRIERRRPIERVKTW